MEKKLPKSKVVEENKKVIDPKARNRRKKKSLLAKPAEKTEQKPLNKIENTIELIEDTLEAIGDEDGWAFLGDVGNLIVKKKPEFDPRNYGFSKLTPMLKSLTDILEIDERESDKKGIKHVYVRLRYS